MDQAKQAMPDMQPQSPESMGIRCDACGRPADGPLCSYHLEEAKEAHRNELEGQRRKRNAEIDALGGIKAYEEYKLESFKPNTNTQAAYDAAAAFALDRSLFFFGPAGTGKTHLAIAAARKFEGARVVKPMALSREVRMAQDQDGAAGEDRVIKKYSTASPLVIDDLGVAKSTDYSVAVLYEIIDRRCLDRRGGLIVTSNMGLNGLAQKLGDDRTASRLSAMCDRFSFIGEHDHRLQK